MAGRVETSSSGNVPARRGVYLLTHPRSASNMFETMMSKQPGFQNSGYKMYEATFSSLVQLHRGPLSQWPEEDRKARYDAYRKSFDALQDELAEAERIGKQVFIKEHVVMLQRPDQLFGRFYPNDQVEILRLYERDAPNSTHTNPTILPDSLLLSLQPIFQIRHPMLMFPSLVRAQSKALGPTPPRDMKSTAISTLRYSRELFDWYDKHEQAMTPQVVDADDIINDKNAIRQLCLSTGLNPDAVQYEWEPRVETDPIKAAFVSTVYASNGIIPSLSSRGLDIEKEKEKWRAEFGEEDAEDLAKLVVDAMPDYDYLLSRRTYTAKVDTPQAED